MFCIKCGKENKDSSKFCIFCGEKLQTNTQETFQTSVTESESSEILTQRKSLTDEFKKFLLSPLVIVAVALFTVYIVSSIMGAGNIIYNTIDKIGEYLNIDDLDYYFEYTFGFALDVINDILRVIVLVIMIPNIVICVGLWITLYSAYDKKSVTVTVTGTKIVKAVNIVTIVLNAILILPYTLTLLANFIGEWGFIRFEDWLLLVILLGVVFLRFFYLFKINTTLNSFIKSVNNNFAVSGASKFLAVMLIISGAFQCLLGLFSFATFSMWCSALSSICFALIIFKFKNLCESKLKEESM